MKKRTFFLLFLLICAAFISMAQSNRLSVSLDQVSLKQVFELIQKQSQFIIFYNDNQVDQSRKVTIHAKNLSVEQVLDQALKDMGLEYKIFDRQIIIFKSRDNGRATDLLQMPDAGQVKKTITGTVTDEHGNLLPGVSVFVKATSLGVTTDRYGRYSLEVPVISEHLVFSFVGKRTHEESLPGKTQLDVMLISEDFDVEEVIVSALGIPRKEKSLSYSTQTIGYDEISGNRDFSFINGLAGKIAGMEINRSAAGAGGSSKVILRGNKSLNNSSEPLFVIDGIPMANNKGGQLGLFAGADQGDGLSQINIDDIESITVLKGANAAALYGSQGANGVILISTKRSREGELDVRFSSYFTLETIQKTPDLQFEYGSSGGAKESWSSTKGDYPNNYVKDFFQTGSNLTNTVIVSNGGEWTSSHFALSNTSLKGVIPNNKYQKINLSFRQSTKLLNDQIRIGSNIMLTDETTNNKNVAGYYVNPLTGLYLFPRDRSFSNYAENYQVFNENRNMYLQNWFVEDHLQSNPYWIINNETKEDRTKRLIGSVSIDYDIQDNLKLQLRGNYDYATRLYEEQHKAGSNITNVHENGRWAYTKISDELIYGDVILTYEKQFEKVSLITLLGTSYQKSTYGHGISVDTDTNGLIYPNEFNFQNIAKNVLVSSVLGSRLIKESVFANVQIGFDEKIFLNFSGRKDWASSLYGTGNDSYLYPSTGIAAIVSELFELPEFLSFAKIRGSYTLVANEVPFNSVAPGHTISTSGVVFNTTRPFTNLKPEMIRSLEAGTNLRLFNGSLGLDFTYYNINSRDQFISLPAPSGSGYTNYFVNAGEIINSGVELAVNAKPVATQSFSWLSAVNFADNKNKIVALHPNLKNPIVLSDIEGYQLVIKEGGSFGDIYVHKFLKDGQGRILLNADGTIPKTENKEYIGNSNQRFSLGLTNKLIYKNLSFEFLINGKFGGKVISQTEAMLDGYGVSQRSADARDNGGVKINAVLPDGTPVDQMDARQYFASTGGRDGIKEPYAYSRTNIRLAQTLLAYDWILSGKWIKQIQLSLVGQNLFFLYRDAPFDTEVTLNTKTQDQAIDNFIIPATRSLGFSIKVRF